MATPGRARAGDRRGCPGSSLRVFGLDTCVEETVAALGNPEAGSRAADEVTTGRVSYA